MPWHSLKLLLGLLSYTLAAYTFHTHGHRLLHLVHPCMFFMCWLITAILPLAEVNRSHAAVIIKCLICIIDNFKATTVINFYFSRSGLYETCCKTKLVFS